MASKRSRGAGAPRDEVGVLLGVAAALFVDELDAALEAAGHSPSRGWYGFVMRVLETGPLPLRDLAQQMQMSSPGALKIVDRMVADGYVERGTDEADGRRRTICLTDRGRGALAAARTFQRTFERQLAASIGEEMVEVLRTALTAIVATGADRVPEVFRASR